ASRHLRQGALVNKLWIAEVRVPIEVVVDGVINSAGAFAAESHVQGSHSCVIEERGVIRAVTQRADAQFSPIAQLFALLNVAGASDAPQIGALPHRDVLLRVLNLALDLVSGALQRVRARDVQVTARAGIGVDIDNGVLPKFILM